MDRTSLDHSIYLLLWIDDGGHVAATSPPIVAGNDTHARHQATALADGDHVELWQGMRIVARINPKPMPMLGVGQPVTHA